MGSEIDNVIELWLNGTDITSIELQYEHTNEEDERMTKYWRAK